MSLNFLELLYGETEDFILIGLKVDYPFMMAFLETPTTAQCFKTQRPCSIAGKCKSH